MSLSACSAHIAAQHCKVCSACHSDWTAHCTATLHTAELYFAELLFAELVFAELRILLCCMHCAHCRTALHAGCWTVLCCYLLIFEYHSAACTAHNAALHCMPVASEFNFMAACQSRAISSSFLLPHLHTSFTPFATLELLGCSSLVLSSALAWFIVHLCWAELILNLTWHELGVRRDHPRGATCD